MGGVIKQATKVVKKVLSPAQKAAQALKGGTPAAALAEGSSASVESLQKKMQTKVAEEKKKVNPASVKRGVSAGEMESPMAKAARRRGRRSNVMSGSRGVMGSASTTKKTLLGG